MRERYDWPKREREREREREKVGWPAYKKANSQHRGCELWKALRISDLPIAYKTRCTSSKASQRSHSVGCL